MGLLRFIGAKPKKIRSAVMTAYIHKCSALENVLKIQCGVDNGFFRIGTIGTHLTAIGSEYSGTATSWNVHYRPIMCPHQFDARLADESGRVKDE
jgi:hypothetical protein